MCLLVSVFKYQCFEASVYLVKSFYFPFIVSRVFLYYMKVDIKEEGKKAYQFICLLIIKISIL